MQSELLGLGERAATLIDSWTQTYASILGAGLSPEATNNHTPGVKLVDLNVRVISALGVAAGLQGEVPVEFRLPAGRPHAAFAC